MLNKIYKSKIILTAGLLGFFVVVNYFLTWTLYNPAVMVPMYRFFVDRGLLVSWGEAENSDDLYPVVSIRDIERSLVWVPRVSVIGIISDQVKVFDGDMHLNIKDKDGYVLVGEEKEI